MEWLKKLLESATIADGALDVDATMEVVKKEFSKHAVPKADYNDKVKALGIAKTTIETLKNDYEDNEALQETIKTHEGTIETLKNDYETQLKNMKIDSAISTLLTSNKAKHSDLLTSKFDRDKLVVDGDKVIGLDEQFGSIKETYKDLFEKTVAGKSPENPDFKTNPMSTFEDLFDRADSMTAEEVAEQFAAMETK